MKSICKTITVPCREHSIGEVGDLVRESLAEVDLSLERKDLIRQSIEETLGSLVRYSNYKGYRHNISVTADVDEGRFRVVFADSLKEFVCGGDSELVGDTPYRMGMTTARRIMNEISYTYKKGARNELELVHSL